MRLVLVLTPFTLALLLPACGPSGELTGKLTLAGDASAATVLLTGPVTRVAAVSSDGAYTFDSLPDGLYLLEASVPSTLERAQSARVEVKGSSSAAPELSFTATGGVSGRVTAPSGVVGAEVFIPGTP